MARSRIRLVGQLWRWHRRIGVLAALFVLFISISGILLNHSAELGLDRRYVSWTWLRALYGDHTEARMAFALGGRLMSQADSGMLLLDEVPLSACDGDLRGAVQGDGLLLAACERQLMLFTPEGELLESIDAAAGLVVPVEALAQAAGEVLLRSRGSWFSMDLDALRFVAVAAGASGVEEIRGAPVPPALRQRLRDHSAWLNFERVVLDLHSGRVFGAQGELLVDLLAVVFSLMALSGIAMWLLHRRPW